MLTRYLRYSGFRCFEKGRCERSKKGLGSREGCDEVRRERLGSKGTRVLIYMMMRKAESFPVSVLSRVTRCDSNGGTTKKSEMDIMGYGLGMLPLVDLKFMRFRSLNESEEAKVSLTDNVAVFRGHVLLGSDRQNEVHFWGKFMRIVKPKSTSTTQI